MIGDRQAALLQAAATLRSQGATQDEAVEGAYRLLSLIEAREKASYGSKPLEDGDDGS